MSLVPDEAGHQALLAGIQGGAKTLILIAVVTSSTYSICRDENFKEYT
jgi:hypothetical protein